MAQLPKKLREKLVRRSNKNALRHLPTGNDLVDFSSNDYLGFSRNHEIFERATQILSEKNITQNGATGSRLLSGNHILYDELETTLAEFHDTESALVYNSGYDANIGFFGSVPQRGDIVFYDEYIHASIRDGIKMGNAKSYKFRHNDLEDLKLGIERSRNKISENTEMVPRGEVEVYIVTESVFSMDGDSPDLKAFADFCQENNARLIVDEAHAVGICGENGVGLVQHLGIQDAFFARIVTFGKALGCHGAAILGSMALKNYLINFSRSLVYTTALPPHSIATILSAYKDLSEAEKKGSKKKDSVQTKYHPISILAENIEFFNLELTSISLSLAEGSNTASPLTRLKTFFIPSNSAIHCCVIAGNERVRKIAQRMQNEGFDVRPILSPTVPEGKERLRICLHSFNKKKEIHELLKLLSRLI